MRDILLKILAAIEDLAPVGSVAASPDDTRQTESKEDEPKQEEPKEEPVEEAPVETKSTRRASK